MMPHLCKLGIDSGRESRVILKHRADSGQVQLIHLGGDITMVIKGGHCVVGDELQLSFPEGK